MTPCCQFENSGHAKACEHYQFREVQSRNPLPNPTTAGPPIDPQIPEPWKQLTDADLLPWWARHPEFVGTARVARMLGWLEQEFGPQDRTEDRNVHR